MEELGGKVAVVTGGASGIGSGMCRAFAREGMSVVVADLDGDGAQKLAEELRGQRTRAVGVPVDVAQRASVQHLADVAQRELGGVDVVCNNAGVYIGGPMSELTEDDWRWVLSVNLDGVFHGSQIFAPILRERGGGHIVNTASVGGLMVASFAAVYSVSKFGVVAYTEALRDELKPHGVGVSVLCPGPVRTGLAGSDEKRPGDLSDAGGRSEVLWDMIKDGLQPDEVGPIVVRGIRANAPYIFTDPSFRAPIEQRFNAILKGFDLLES